MSEAIDFFKNDAYTKTKCKELQKDYTKSLSWESECVSAYSPGIITNDETLIRAWYVPLHIELTSGVLKPTAYDDAFNKGLSINRVKFSSLADLEKEAIVRAEVANETRGNRNYYGYSSVLVEKIRNSLAYGMRVFAIYDTAMDKEKGYSHGDICVIIAPILSEELTKKVIKRIARGRLSEYFSTMELYG